jgi:hypothetical protein
MQIYLADMDDLFGVNDATSWLLFGLSDCGAKPFLVQEVVRFQIIQLLFVS